MILISSQNTMTLQEFTSNLRQRGKEKKQQRQIQIAEGRQYVWDYSTKDTNGEIEGPIA